MCSARVHEYTRVSGALVCVQEYTRASDALLADKTETWGLEKVSGGVSRGRGALERGAAVLTHRVALEHEAVAVMHEPIEHGVGDGAIAEVGVPLTQRQLAGNEGRAPVVAVLEGSPARIAHGFIGERGDAEVFDHDQVGLGELAVEP